MTIMYVMPGYAMSLKCADILQARRTQLATHEAFKNVAHPATLYAVRDTTN